ncbi:hypothetical protein KEU06_06060 [Pseudaminobacter sp. 19-2017]|uniref:DUF3828 domain-containing protein n=1 Tax=Pseudaminobacter soli (ex Zhang et al. 2022) TaxID=2831468 RepID=A0A942DZV3_9HYPH|nr:hypothetical protein [Pseudaminobacter soli]MBS3648190.1 hypothetical protein [Pseudaminobacter soli]
MSVAARLAAALAAGVMVVSMTVANAWAQSTAAELTAAFCATRMAGNDTEVKPLLTPALLKLVEEAEQRSRAIAQAQPDEKPPFGDGIPYQSFPDKPDTCVPDEPVAKAGITEAPVTYAIAAAPEASWTDTLILTLVEGKMLIDDIRFPGAADGGDSYTLREILSDAFDQ